MSYQNPPEPRTFLHVLLYLICFIKMSLSCVPPYVATGSDAGFYEPNNIPDSIPNTVSDSETSKSDESTQTVSSSVTRGSADEKDGYEANTDSTSSSASTRMSRRPSRSQSPLSSVGDECSSEDVKRTNQDVGLEQPNGTNIRHSPKTNQVDQVGSVFPRDLPVLSRTVSAPRYLCLQCVE